METEKFIFECSVGHWTNKGVNQIICKVKWKWKHNLAQPPEHNITVQRRKFIVMSAFIVNNVMFHLKLL
jgi:hypothetical protein